MEESLEQEATDFSFVKRSGNREREGVGPNTLRAKSARQGVGRLLDFMKSRAIRDRVKVCKEEDKKKLLVRFEGGEEFVAWLNPDKPNIVQVTVSGNGMSRWISFALPFPECVDSERSVVQFLKLIETASPKIFEVFILWSKKGAFQLVADEYKKNLE